MINVIRNESCVETMASLDEQSVDLVVTSPPYDDLREYNGYSFDFPAVVAGLDRVLKAGGVIVWIVGDATIKGSETGTSFRQALGFIDAGFNLHDTMIWRKTNPIPKIKVRRYFDVFEYMFVLSKGQPKTFNPMMQPTKLGGKVYDSTSKKISPGKERIQKTFVLNKERYRDNIWEWPRTGQNTRRCSRKHSWSITSGHGVTRVTWSTIRLWVPALRHWLRYSWEDRSWAARSARSTA
jgi:DNA modification methylase